MHAQRISFRPWERFESEQDECNNNGNHRSPYQGIISAKPNGEAFHQHIHHAERHQAEYNRKGGP